MTKRDVVGEGDDMGSSPEVVLPLAEGGEEGQELAFVGGIVVLGGREFFWRGSR